MRGWDGKHNTEDSSCSNEILGKHSHPSDLISNLQIVILQTRTELDDRSREITSTNSSWDTDPEGDVFPVGGL